MYREHPLRILKYSLKNIWLLIFPLLRTVPNFRFDKSLFYSWLQGAWMDIAVLGIILIFGFVRWYFSVIDFTEKEIVHRDGVFFRMNTFIPYSNISSATLEQPLYLVPFGAAKFNCDTRAGLFKTNDLKLLVSRKAAKEIFAKMPKVNESDLISGIPKPSLLSVLTFSVLFSSGFSGAIYIATFFWKAGDISYDIITKYLNRFTEETEKITNRFILKIPTAAAAIGLFILLSWLISFAVNLIRYSGFVIQSDKKCMKVTYGLLNHKEYSLKTSHINYTDLRQNLIMKIGKAVSVNISCPGYGATKNRLPVILPVKKESNIGRNLEFIGVYGKVSNQFRPRVKGFGSYIGLPIFAAAMLYPTHDLIAGFFPRFSELSLFISVMLTIPSVWMIAVKFVALQTSGVAFSGDNIIVRSCMWTSFHTVAAEKSRVAKYEIQYDFMQLWSDRCNIRFWFEGDERRYYRIRAMSIEDAEKIAELLENNLDFSVKSDVEKHNKKKLSGEN